MQLITNDNNLYINYDRFIKHLLINKKQQMDKEQLINKLSLLDASAFRCINYVETGIFNRETINYRTNLNKVYSKLDIENLKQLLKIRTNEKR